MTLTLFSCTVNNWDITRYKNKFQTHKQDFDTLVSLLKKQNLRVGYFVNETELPKNIRIVIEDLSITNISLNVTDCEQLPDYEFTSSWSSKATLYFSNNFCDKEQTNKGYHSKPSEMIEVWGMGDGWVMWIDYDFI